jgi:predicted CXXCH cytochrome family protein
MKTGRGWILGFLLVGLGGVVAVVSSCSTVQRSIVEVPLIEGASFVGNKACFECHTNITRAFASSAHARLHIEGAKMAGQAGCESCHGPGSRHIAAGGGKARFILNPGRDSQACLTCHLQVHAELRLPQRHPILEGKMNCVQCHDPHGGDIMKPARVGLAMARVNESCGECHREQALPHVYEHDALREGCVTCHQPHGSINAKMLVERDSNLCLKCHAQVQGATPGQLVIGAVNHSQFVTQGSCWSAGCHPAVHGSNVSPFLHY